MDNNLNTLLTNWKTSKTSLNELRTVNNDVANTQSGFYKIVLKMSVRVTDMGRSETVSLSRKIIVEVTPDVADIFLFNAQQLVKDFEKKCSLTYARLSRSQNPDHNPYS